MKGPQPRSWKDADGAAATREFLAHKPPRKAAIRDLMRAVLSSDPFVRRCATDLARRVSAREPGVLGDYVGVFIDLLAELPAEVAEPRLLRTGGGVERAIAWGANAGGGGGAALDSRRANRAAGHRSGGVRHCRRGHA